MAVEIKVAPDERLELVRAQITDTTLNSEYFNVTELSDTFSGGKNAFLIAGSELLEPNTEVKVQIRDSAGEVLYCEFSDGYPDEYYEGISKVVAVYVYPTETAFGPATITLIGQIKDSLDLVKWERKINIDPSLPNTTRVRFYKRPKVSIVEELAPIYSFDITGSKVASNVTQSFANIKISQLDTFAGDVKRVKVFRTSEGDISDYDLIQDILIESKELLTTTELSGSVVSNAGLFTSETLSKLWNTGSLSTALTSSRIDNGLSLKGSGYLRYTSSLNLNSGNTYELGIDAFYSASTASDLGIYVSGSQNGETLIGTLNGITPTKNLTDQVFAFTLDKAEPTASLYLSQSQNEWHVGNISLKLSEDSAFSPSEVSFVTSMPTVIGNETYNFKFEFYDVNNNFVPVAVTQSALFSGGNNNIGGTLTIVSASTSALSSSVSYDLWFNPTGSVTASITTVSGSVSSVSASISGTISTVSSSLSSSISQSRAASISSSFGNIQTLANGKFSGSFISDTTIFAPVIGGNTGYISDLFKVGTAPSIYLDARQNPRKIFIGGVTDSGSYNNSNTSVYMDSTGKFSLGNKLSWDSTTSVLNVTGVINITSGPTYDSIATAQSTANTAQSTANTANSTANTANSTANSALSTANAADAKIFNNIYGKLIKAPDVGSGGGGLYLGNTNMGYYGAQGWMTYMDNSGLFFLKGSNGAYGLQWNPTGNQLTVDGNITAQTLTANVAGTIANWNIDNTRLFKSVAGIGSMELRSSDNTINMYDTNGIFRLQLNPRTTLPTLTTPGTTATLLAADGDVIDVGPGTNVTLTRNMTAVGITLSSANNEIYVPFSDDRWIDPAATPEDNASYAFKNFDLNFLTEGQYYLQVVLTGGSISGELVQTIGFVKTSISVIAGTTNNYYAAALYTSPALFSNLPAGSYSIKIRHYLFAEKINGGTIGWNRWPRNWDDDGITVLYGASDAYSVLNAGGMVLSQGSQNYLQIKQPTTGTDSFFSVRGKSTFLNGLFVQGSLAATNKQFQITHPLDDKKWLYHTSIEAPRADLIYRGKIELINGSGSIGIDSSSLMTGGTFESLTKNRQLFLQNNQTFDRVKGYIQNGNVYVLCENTNENILVDWMVTAERNDIEIISSRLYDSDGNYKPERYKDYLFQQNLETNSGSI